jgi:cystathionine gamma-synthase
VWTYATSLGGVESLLERRRRWPLESATVPEGLVRLSVGIEAVEDLWTDLDRALRMAPDAAREQAPSPSPTASGA